MSPKKWPHTIINTIPVPFDIEFPDEKTVIVLTDEELDFLSIRRFVSVQPAGIRTLFKTRENERKYAWSHLHSRDPEQWDLSLRRANKGF